MQMRKGFTLIELLVVIGILSSMLMPALSKAREATKVAVCINQTRQIGLVVLGEIENYNEQFMPSYGEDGYSWVKRVDSLMKNVSLNDSYDFGDNNPGKQGVWYCPSYNLDPDSYGSATFVHTGYNHSSLVGGGGNSNIGGKPGGSVGLVEKPVDTLLVGDAVHWNGLKGHWEMTFKNYNFRHHFGKSMNFMFIDGHLENLKISTLTTDENRLKKLNDGTWR
jgi:prepilin-type N-terminal cleavage/methylation domain-containing protein